MSDSDHVVAYVSTSKATDWKRIAFKHKMATGEPLLVYRSDSPSHFARDARPGATLWVIQSHRGRPPSLTARLDIAGRIRATQDKKILEQEGEVGAADQMLHRFDYTRESESSWYVVGSPSSRFFGYNDISRALLATTLAGKPAWGAATSSWEPQLGYKLQQPRTIRGGAAQLIDAAEQLALRSVFLSWKHRDLKKQWPRVQLLVDELASAGFDCWWDHRALPRSRALGKIQRDPQLLGELLRDGLAHATALLALGSPRYGRPSRSNPTHNWTADEWHQAKTRFVWERWGQPSCGWPTNAYTALPTGLDEAEVAEELLARMQNGPSPQR